MDAKASEQIVAPNTVTYCHSLLHPLGSREARCTLLWQLFLVLALSELNWAEELGVGRTQQENAHYSLPTRTEEIRDNEVKEERRRLMGLKRSFQDCLSRRGQNRHSYCFLFLN